MKDSNDGVINIGNENYMTYYENKKENKLVLIPNTPNEFTRLIIILIALASTLIILPIFITILVGLNQSQITPQDALILAMAFTTGVAFLLLLNQRNFRLSIQGHLFQQEIIELTENAVKIKDKNSLKLLKTIQADKIKEIDTTKEKQYIPVLTSFRPMISSTILNTINKVIKVTIETTDDNEMKILSLDEYVSNFKEQNTLLRKILEFTNRNYLEALPQ